MRVYHHGSPKPAATPDLRCAIELVFEIFTSVEIYNNNRSIIFVFLAVAGGSFVGWNWPTTSTGVPVLTSVRKGSTIPAPWSSKKMTSDYGIAREGNPFGIFASVGHLDASDAPTVSTPNPYTSTVALAEDIFSTPTQGTARRTASADYVHTIQYVRTM